MPGPAFIAFFVLLVPLAANAGSYSDLRLSGKIYDRRIIEASGLARSHVVADRLWTLNDGDAKPELFAIDGGGNLHGSISLSPATNVDWEDIASFEHDGKSWLLIADIGDNEAKRRYCSLYVVEEPAELHKQKLEPARQIRFTYPDGPLDAESVAVDAENDSVLILVKRTVPARLYSVPLLAGDDDSIRTAELLGDVATLPQPSQLELDRALAHQSWHWQPTAMDITRNGRTAAILTYRGIYIYQRLEMESWIDALQRVPQDIDFPTNGIAEAIAFSYKDDSLFVTVEGRSPPIYRSDLQGQHQR
ncbi:MAG: hypothetical protein OEW68_04335 [Gammaproteobacteria bacterium]|nr:hypothetical protein [Gammaproteobacteria bacterium]MDH4314051.1 hypothetical protein [Gammaproteobacteria bacterium]MDH5213509.1 hypothetical protein [Gammaproteobacteria bacterium]MDH5502112.1 hypothetical protein [Gammaproteobacteria bacterium]